MKGEENIPFWYPMVPTKCQKAQRGREVTFGQAERN